MNWNIETDDIRWYKCKSQTRCTYLESLTEQIKRGNSWISKSEWDDLKKRLPNMDENQAKIELFKIINIINDRIERYRIMYN